VLGATGKAGTEIVKELLKRGHKVIAIARDPSKIKAAKNLEVRKGFAEGDFAELIKGAGVVAHCYAPPKDNESELVTVTTALKDAAAAVDARLIMVGGAGSLEVDLEPTEGCDCRGKRLIDQDYFPEEYKAIAKAHCEALDVLKASSMNWTSVSPALELFVGERTGKYRTNEEKVVMLDGKSRVSNMFIEYI
jgi:uncharacterized protein